MLCLLGALFVISNCVSVDYASVKSDILVTLTDSKDFWPADFGNYGPFMIRHAWHCSGTYRTFDGRGGCDGARQRFEPELSWDDNTNLDKAKKVLLPIKEKYGPSLSWGDLIVLTGTTAIESMGGPVLGFCGGRIDEYDGSESRLLGPSRAQNKSFPCLVNGKCKPPLGTTTIGLIYVNPEGPMAQPDPVGSISEIRTTFGQMNMDDMETVALIGGGHAFGKTHGACPLGPGPSPAEQPSNPWPGKCGTGKGKDTYTSGFEGSWTTSPTRWGNEYFYQLVTYNWTVHKGPGGHWQWKATNGPPKLMMLTSDIALTRDPKYFSIVKMFADNQTLLNEQFSRAWYKLVSRDMGPATRCVGPFVPPPQPFQNPLPPPPQTLVNFGDVSEALKKVLTTVSPILPPDFSASGPPQYYGIFIHLAYQCSATFRHTDYQGGCNGARIRFSPESDWKINKEMNNALDMLAPVKNLFKNLSWADLVVLAGTVSIARTTNLTLNFCGGRTDATDGAGSMLLQPTIGYDANSDDIRTAGNLLGFTDREIVVLSGRYRSPAYMKKLGYSGSWVDPRSPTKFVSNKYFVTLLNEVWVPENSPSGLKQFKAASKDLYMTPADLNLLWDPRFYALVQDFASDSKLFLREFSAAWVKLMNIDRFNGPTGNVCN